jgi:hypothetical protein
MADGIYTPPILPPRPWAAHSHEPDPGRRGRSKAGVGAGGRFGAVAALGVFRSRISNLLTPTQPFAKPSADLLGRVQAPVRSGLSPRGRASYHNNWQMQLLECWRAANSSASPSSPFEPWRSAFSPRAHAQQRE